MKKILFLTALLLMGIVQTVKAQDETTDCGTLIIPPIYDKVEAGGTDGLFVVTKGKKKGVVNSDGTIVVPIKYDGAYIGKYGEDCGGLIVVSNDYEKEIVEDGIESVNRYTVTESIDGLYNKEGVMLAPMGKFEHIYLRNKGLAKVSIKINEVSTKYGVLLKDGTLLSSYDRIYIEDGGLIIVEKDRKKGVLNENGEVIVPVQYEDVQINEDFITVIASNPNGSKKYGLYNNKGQNVVPVGKYESVGFEKSYIVVKRNGKTGILNSKGVEIVPIGMYTKCNISECNDRNSYYIEVESNNRKGALNDNGKIFVPIGKYEDFRILNKKLASVKLNGKTGIVNNSGAVIVPLGKYERIVYQYGMIIYFQNGKFGILDRNGNQATTAEYDFINPARYSHEIALIKKDGKIGVIDCDGKIVIPLGDYKDGKINGDIGFLKSDEGTMFFDRSGRILAPMGKIERCMREYGLIEGYGNEEGLFSVKSNDKYGIIKLW